jgi:hypothetical protein
MKRTYLYLKIVAFVLISLQVEAQKSLPYYTGFDTYAEKAGWQSYELGVTGTYGRWTFDSYLHHDYSNIGPVNDWVVSPALLFTNSAKISFKAQLFYMYYFDSGSYTGLWYSPTYQHPDSGSYIEVANLTNRSAYSYKWFDTTINIGNINGAGYIAFRYKTRSGWFTALIDSITVSGTSAISEKIEANDILIYPNPVRTFGTIEVNPMLSNKGMELIIFNLYGKKVRQIYSADNSITFNRNGLSGGMYFYKLVHNNQILATGKIMIE